MGQRGMASKQKRVGLDQIVGKDSLLWGSSERPGEMEDIPAHGRGLGLGDL